MVSKSAEEGAGAEALLPPGQAGLNDATLTSSNWATTDQWDGLLKYLQQVEVWTSASRSGRSGGAQEGGNGFYDRFRHRVMVPIMTVRSVIGFAAAASTAPNLYLNSPKPSL